MKEKEVNIDSQSEDFFYDNIKITQIPSEIKQIIISEYSKHDVLKNSGITYKEFDELVKYDFEDDKTIHALKNLASQLKEAALDG